MIPGDNEIQGAQDESQVEARYRALEQDQPPAMLDEAVLNKARRAVESRPVRPWNFGWMHATATAAVLVLGLTLVLQQRSEVINTGPGLDGSAPAKTESASVVAETKEKPYLDGTIDLDQRENEAFRTLKQRTSAQAAAQKPDDSVPAAEEQRRETIVKSERTALPEREPAPAVTVGAISADEKASGKIDKRPDQPALEPAPGPAERVRAAGADGSEAEEELLTTGGDMISDLSGSMDNPDDWIATILELKHTGQGDAWRMELEMFRQAYPDYPLPEELRGQVP